MGVSVSRRMVRVIPSFGLVAVTAVLVWPAVAHAAEVWATDEEFSFGFLVLPIAAGLIWWRRGALRRSLGRGATAGLAIVLPSLALYLLARRAGVHALAGAVVSPLLWGMAVYVWGWGAGRVLAFPLGFLVFGLGLYRGLLNSVGFAMQRLTATGAAAGARALGLAVERDGVILRADGFAFVVADTCSGMSSLVALLALAALWTSTVRGPLPARAAVVLSVLPLVVLANAARVTLVLLVAARFGPDTAVGAFHGGASLALFGLSLGGLLLVSRMVGCKAPGSAA